MSTASMSTPTPPVEGSGSLRSVAERLNIFQDLEARDKRFEELSRDITNQLFILFRSASLYDLDNVALDQPYGSFLASTTELHEILRAPVALRHNEGNFFVNRRQVKLDFSTFQNTRYLAKIVERLDINEITFEPGVSRADLKQLLSAFLRIAQEKRGSLRDVSINHISGRKLKVGEVHPLLNASSAAERTVAWYVNTRFTTQNFYRDALAGRTPEHALLKRSLLSLLELPVESRALLSCLHLLTERAEESGALSTHSVEAAGITQTLAEGLQLGANTRLALASSAIQLFQGWTLTNGEEALGVTGVERDGEMIDPQSLNSTALVFDELKSPVDQLRARRNDIVRTLLNLGGISESAITRAVITFEAQRDVKTQWESGDDDRKSAGANTRGKRSLARPQRSGGSRLYSSGFGRSFLTDLVYGAHLYAYVRRARGVAEAMSALKSSTLIPQVKRAFHELLGSLAPGSVVELSDQRYAIVLECRGDQVSEAIVINLSGSSAPPSLGEHLTLRATSPIQVIRALEGRERDQLITRVSLRALLFSKRAYPSASPDQS